MYSVDSKPHDNILLDSVNGMPLFRTRTDFGVLELRSLDYRGLNVPPDLPPTYEDALYQAEEMVPRSAPDVVDWMIEATADNILLSYYAYSVARGATRFGIAADEPSSTASIVAASGDGYSPGVTAGYIRAVGIPNYTGGYVHIRNALGQWINKYIDFGGVLKDFNLRNLGHIPQVFYLKRYSGVQNKIVAIDIMKLVNLVRGLFKGSWKLPGLRNEIKNIIQNPSAAFHLRTIIPLPVNNINLRLDVDSPGIRHVYIRIRDEAGKILANFPVKLSGYQSYSISAVVSGMLPRNAIIEVEPAGIPASSVRELAVRGSIFG